jgi:hypothetical protein
MRTESPTTPSLPAQPLTYRGPDAPPSGEEHRVDGVWSHWAPDDAMRVFEALLDPTRQWKWNFFCAGGASSGYVCVEEHREMHKTIVRVIRATSAEIEAALDRNVAYYRFDATTGGVKEAGHVPPWLFTHMRRERNGFKLPTLEHVCVSPKWESGRQLNGYRKTDRTFYAAGAICVIPAQWSFTSSGASCVVLGEGEAR